MNIQDEAYSEAMDEIKRLKFLVKEEQETIDELSKLCLRAADALEGRIAALDWKLIAELQKAAE